MPRFEIPPPTIDRSAHLLGLDLAPAPEEYTLQVPVVGEKTMDWPSVYNPRNIAPPVRVQEPVVNQDFTQLSGYQNQLGKSPALRQDEYNPSTLRRILAGVAGGTAGYQGGGLAGLQTSEAILDTPYRRAMQRYHDSLEPFAAGAKTELDKYGKDIDFYGKSTTARKQGEDINREREKSSREETKLSLESIGAQAQVSNSRNYERSVAANATQLIPGFGPQQPEIYQTHAVDKLSGTAKPTGLKPVNPFDLQRMKDKAAKERAQIISTFNVTSQQLRIAELGATARVHAKHPEFDRFFNPETGLPEWTGGEQAGAEWLAYQDALSQHTSETKEILGTVKSKSGVNKKFIGGYEIVEEAP